MKRTHNIVYYVAILVMIAKIGEGFDVKTVTPAGTFRGNRRHLNQLNKNVEVYLSIKYAVAPIHDLRFKDPVPMPNVQHVDLGLETFPPSCPQANLSIFQDVVGLNEWMIQPKIEEDCLYLNIWKPTEGPTKKPVIVWIHGGGFNIGGSSIPVYEGSHLAAWSDAVVVSIQYRLGVFGFLYTGDEFAPGNVGLKDQVLALKWVRNNIEYFGGDKEMITVVGESAGGMSVGFHLLSNETSKLFKRAILLSGTPNNDWGAVTSSVARERTFALAAKLGANVSKYEDVKHYLIQREWYEILREIPTDMLQVMFYPSIESTLIPEHPLRMLRKSYHLKGKEMIAGWTKDEGSMFVAMEMLKMKKIQKTTDTPLLYYNDFVEKLTFLAGNDKHAVEKLATIYKEKGDKPYLKGLVRAYGDIGMMCPINQYIEESRKLGATVYQFEYDHRTKNIPWPEWMGTVHASDLEMFFGQPLYQGTKFSMNDYKLCDKFLNRIQHFIKTGSPNIPGQESWFKNQMFVFSHDHRSIDNRTSTCEKLKEILPHFLSGTQGLHFDLFWILGLLIFLRILL